MSNTGGGYDNGGTVIKNNGGTGSTVQVWNNGSYSGTGIKQGDGSVTHSTGTAKPNG